MLRPASLLSTEWTFDAPLGRSTSLPSPGACYRALRRLPGQDSHLLEERVFQDAPRSHSIARRLDGRACPADGHLSWSVMPGSGGCWVSLREGRDSPGWSGNLRELAVEARMNSASIFD